MDISGGQVYILAQRGLEDAKKSRSQARKAVEVKAPREKSSERNGR